MSEIATLEAKADSLLAARTQADDLAARARAALGELQGRLDAALVAGDVDLCGRLHADIRAAEQGVEDADRIVEGIHQRQQDTNSELHRARVRAELDALDRDIPAKQADLELAGQHAVAAWLELRQIVADAAAAERALGQMQRERAEKAAHLAGETRIPPVLANHPFQRVLAQDGGLVETARIQRWL